MDIYFIPCYFVNIKTKVTVHLQIYNITFIQNFTISKRNPKETWHTNARASACIYNNSSMYVD